MKRIILPVLLLLFPLIIFSQVTYLTNTDYFVVREKHGVNMLNYLVSYDNDLNRLGHIQWILGDRWHECQRDYIVVYRNNSSTSNGVISTYNPDFTLINQHRVTKGELREVIPTDEYILTLENKGIFTPFYFVTYDKEFNKLGELRKRDRDIEYFLQNDKLIVIEGKKGNRTITMKMHVYDKNLKLIKTTELQ